jgi:2-dehydropantoate 2-reductase
MNNTSHEASLTIGIIGLGAIGCLISSQLPANSKVLALPRNQNQKNIDFQLHTPTAHDIDSEGDSYQWPVWKDEKLDVLLVCCKASQSIQALQQWQVAISSETQIVLLQNGLGQHQLIAKAFPQNTLFAASTTEGAFRSRTNRVIHAGIGQTQWGQYNGTKTPFKLPLGLLKGKHFWSDNIKQVLLDKLAINAVINPLTVKYQCKNGELLTQPDAYIELKALCEETECFLKKAHWSISFNLLEKTQLIAQLTANNYSSMLQDIRNKRFTEIDFINGYLLNEAIIKGINLPISKSLIKHVKSYEHENKVC